MTRRIRRRSLTLSALMTAFATFGLLSATSAHAADTYCANPGAGFSDAQTCQGVQPHAWQSGLAVGNCGESSGNYVKSFQWILYVGGQLSATSAIDGYFGPTTSNALKTWQSQHGLTADGCAGQNTWYKAQTGTGSYRDPNTNAIVSYKLMNYQGIVTGTTTGGYAGSWEKWKNIESSRTTRSAIFWFSRSTGKWWLLNDFAPNRTSGRCVTRGFKLCQEF